MNEGTAVTVESVPEPSGTRPIPLGRDLERFITPIVLIGAISVLLILGGVTSDAFLTKANLIAVTRVASVTGIVAVCATAVTLSGNFFIISLGQTAVLCSVVFAIVVREGGGVWLALAAAGAAGIVVGGAQGAITALGANPIVVTLGASSLLAGLSGKLTDSSAVLMKEHGVLELLGSGRPLGIPTQTWAFVAILVVVSVTLRKTRMGRETVLRGANTAAARSAGVSVAKVTMMAFVLASLGAATVGVFQAAQFNRATIDTFGTLDFDVIAAILVGGTAASGGEGSPLRSALGALFIVFVNNYMLIQGWSQGARIFVLGVFVISAAVSFHLFRRRGGVLR
jgi:ribose transport system permease protein